jgi:2-oxoglutarate dehydrogenase complex dehydrogenase (E1) component-like enzyme
MKAPVSPRQCAAFGVAFKTLLLYDCTHAAGQPDGAPAKTLWRLHEAIEVMADTYCGTLSLEYKHLQQQDEMTWIQQRFESRRPLTSTQKRQVRHQRTNCAQT